MSIARNLIQSVYIKPIMFDIDNLTFISSELGLANYTSIWGTDDGSSVQMIEFFENTIYKWQLSTPFSAGSAGGRIPAHILNNNNDIIEYGGGRFFTGSSDSRIIDYVSTINITESPILNNSPSIDDIVVHPDGYKFYIVSLSADEVQEYTATTAFDVITINPIPTATFGITNPRSIHFNPNGRQVFLVTSGNLNQFELTTPWDITTMVFTKSISWNTGIWMDSSGKYAYSYDGSNNRINSYGPPA